MSTDAEWASGVIAPVHIGHWPVSNEKEITWPISVEKVTGYLPGSALRSLNTRREC